MYIADLHIHSRYSRATSKDCTPEHLDLWARRKGIQIVGTGDFTHPAWREELQEKLEPAEDGLYVLKKEYRIQDPTAAAAMQPRFVVTGEISSIYKKMDKVRKVHSLILLPGLEDAEIISKKLESIGNIHSDGRPILGLDCRDLLEILLELCPNAVYVPAHIWTPHFSLFGAFSGFDTVEECFDDLSPYIRAMETGLSSDPPMNWRISALDQYQLISNSDAHSPAKLGREANLLDIELSYEGLRKAIQEGEGLAGTIEFFPEEGKYHFDGHRKCHLCLSPTEAEKYHGKCPVCGKKLTIGVSHRVEQLADRPEGFQRPHAKAFESLVPLPEVIGASVGYSAASRKVVRQYEEMLRKLGSEFEILRIMPLEEIRSISGHLITEGIQRLREGKVERIPGFDGEYGTIKLFEQTEIENLDGQMSLFDSMEMIQDMTEITGDAGTVQEIRRSDKTQKNRLSAKVKESRLSEKAQKSGPSAEAQESGPSIPALQPLNPQQQQAVQSIDRAVAVIAG
ncbi:MAG: endonuclease Q family protein, partial [Blautia coccoides]